MATLVSSTVGVVHPLEPLTVEELAAAADIVRTQQGLGPRVRFVSIALHEPPKDVVLGFPVGRPGRARSVRHPARQRAGPDVRGGRLADQRAVVVLASTSRTCSRRSCSTSSWNASAPCKANPDWQAAMRKRGITDFDLCMVDPWSAGNFGIEAETRPTTVARADLGALQPATTTATPGRSKTSSPWSTCTRCRCSRVEDYGVVPLPPEAGQLLERGGRRRAPT